MSARIFGIMPPPAEATADADPTPLTPEEAAWAADRVPLFSEDT